MMRMHPHGPVPAVPFVALIVVLLGARTAVAAPLTLANPDFEAPVQGDAVFVSAPTLAAQGGYGWSFTPGVGVDSGLYNPPANTYPTAAANGTPTGAQGAQVGYILTTGILIQTLAGPDATPGNGDDPVLTANTLYTLTAAVGRRAIGNQYGIDAFGGHTFELLAGAAIVGTISDTDPTILPGTFQDRTLVVDSTTLAPALYGQPLTIRLRGVTNAGVSDFDNVRLDATRIPEPAAATTALAFAACASVRRPRKSADV